MFSKTLSALAVMLLLAAAVGCTCNSGVSVSPSPSPSIKPTSTPMMSTEAPIGPTGDASASASPDAGSGQSTGDPSASGTIPDFKEGTEVTETDVPKVKQAVKEKYPNAEISSIKHTLSNNAQVYEVTVKTSGAEETIFVRPDGTIMEAESTPKA